MNRFHTLNQSLKRRGIWSIMMMTTKLIACGVPGGRTVKRNSLSKGERISDVLITAKTFPSLEKQNAKRKMERAEKPFHLFKVNAS